MINYGHYCSQTIHFIECLLFAESWYRKDERVAVNTLPDERVASTCSKRPFFYLERRATSARKFAVQVNEACVNTRYLMTSGTASRSVNVETCRGPDRNRLLATSGTAIVPLHRKRGLKTSNSCSHRLGSSLTLKMLAGNY